MDAYVVQHILSHVPPSYVGSVCMLVDRMWRAAGKNCLEKKSGYIDMSDLYVMLAKEGDLKMLQWTLSTYPRSVLKLYNSDAVHIAAAAGDHLDVLEWCIDNSFQRGTVVMSAAAAKGHLRIVEWLYEHGMQISGAMVVTAERGGHEHTAHYLKAKMHSGER